MPRRLVDESVDDFFDGPALRDLAPPRVGLPDHFEFVSKVGEHVCLPIIVVEVNRTGNGFEVRFVEGRADVEFWAASDDDGYGDGLGRFFVEAFKQSKEMLPFVDVSTFVVTVNQYYHLRGIGLVGLKAIRAEGLNEQLLDLNVQGALEDGGISRYGIQDQGTE